MDTLDQCRFGAVLCKDASILCEAFTTYVRPVLEYCSPVWSPVAVMLTNQLESVQRCCTKRLPGFPNVTVRRALCFTGTRPSEASSITCRLNSLLQDYTRSGFVVTRQFFHVYLQFKNTWSFIIPAKAALVCLSVCLSVCLFFCLLPR